MDESIVESLERLSRLLDEGKLSGEEYDRLKQELLADKKPAVTGSAVPGWYNDPSGRASHEAYWDGKKWTGATRQGPEAAAATPKKSSAPWVRVVLIAGGVILALAWIGGQFGGPAVEDTFTEIDEGLGGSSSSERVVLEGQGEASSRSFKLNGGSYRVATTVGGDCFYSFRLRDPADGSLVESITSMSEAGSTTVMLHGIRAGNYYVGVITGPAPSCPWSQIITNA